MVRPDIARMGSVGAYGVAALYIVCTALLVSGSAEPPAMPWIMDDETARWFADPPLGYYLFAVASTLLLVFFVPVVTAVSELLDETNAGLVRWGAVMGYIACATGIISRVTHYALIPLRARIYVQGDELAQAAVKYTWIESTVDYHYWIRYGALGFWFLIVAVVALQAARRDDKPLSRGWASFSLLGAILHFAVPLSRLGLPFVAGVLGALGGLVVAPLWGIWTGRKLSSFAQAERAHPARATATPLQR